MHCGVRSNSYSCAQAKLTTLRCAKATWRCCGYALAGEGVQLTEARAKYAAAVTVNQKAQISGTLSASVQRLFATAENYPDLEANATFLELQERITGLENQIADRREFYNDAINLFNTRIRQMPDALLAGMAGFKARQMFQVTASEKVYVAVGMNPVTR